MPGCSLLQPGARATVATVLRVAINELVSAQFVVRWVARCIIRWLELIFGRAACVIAAEHAPDLQQLLTSRLQQLSPAAQVAHVEACAFGLRHSP
ncbi:MAG: hypothetical protein ACK4NM_19030, partial [Hydrogenophaga sp.]